MSFSKLKSLTLLLICTDGFSPNLSYSYSSLSFFGRLPEFESLVETMLENTLLNLLTEANRGEVNLTSRTRVIALPPNRTSKTTR